MTLLAIQHQQQQQQQQQHLHPHPMPPDTSRQLLKNTCLRSAAHEFAATNKSASLGCSSPASSNGSSGQADVDTTSLVASSGSTSLAASGIESHGPGGGEQQQQHQHMVDPSRMVHERQALSLGDIVPPTPIRRRSRCEQRQSLSDLGYGKIESYVKLQRLGRGTYATVYLGRSRLNNDRVALKEILKEHDEGTPCTAIREVSLLRSLSHNNIVILHDVCHTPKKLTLVFEYVGPDLCAYLRDNNHLLSMHNVKVLHRDLKPQNLLINSRGELKICDFGLARAKSIPTKSYSNEVVTLWYRPPDVLLGNTDYNDSIDMWGVGCIFFELASGRTLFPGSNVRQQLYLIFSVLGAPSELLTHPEYLDYRFPLFRPEKLSHRLPRLEPDGVNLLLRFLRYRPSERISAQAAMRDPFFHCLPERIHHLSERQSIFDLPEVRMTSNPGIKLNHL